MKLLFKTIILIAILVPNLHAKADTTLFQYPTAPESLENMEDRCNYVIEHFWDRCNINQAFSTRNKLQQAFSDYVDIMPYASADKVHESVSNLIERVKKNPKQLLGFAEMAEAILYSDTATFVCDEVYYPFAQAVADNKKIKPAEKARFVAQAKILSGSQVGMTAPDFTFTQPDGTKCKFNEIPAGYVILFFYEPDCTDCMMARVRLAADYSINEFIKKKQLNVVCIYPGSPDDATWLDITKRMPDNWIVGACEDVDKIYDMRHEPVIYYLNSRHKILSKSMSADQLINAFREINARSTSSEN
ncbi:MAG: DUF5106 domain-containing protein [Muribaculaceae bacterium]|nr:DUF5106 domain-containing protein [Muribaculaceae bacterium]